jgi:hypothetical protein
MKIKLRLQKPDRVYERKIKANTKKDPSSKKIGRRWKGYVYKKVKRCRVFKFRRKVKVKGRGLASQESVNVRRKV